MKHAHAYFAIVGAAVAALACRDGPTQPSGEARLYRLVSVNGLPLPYQSPPSAGFGSFRVSRGDFLLRPNGTFGLGHDGNPGFFIRGTYVARGDSLTTTSPTWAGNPPDVIGYAIRADSIILEIPRSFFNPTPIRYVYVRTALSPVAVPAPNYVLAAINGQGAPLVQSDTVISNRRYVSRVQFDSLHFSDGLFYHRHRAQTSTSYAVASGDSLWGSDEWHSWGTYARSGGAVILLPYYSVNAWDLPRDSLVVSGTSLVRTTKYIGGTLQETYAAHP